MCYLWEICKEAVCLLGDKWKVIFLVKYNELKWFNLLSEAKTICMNHDVMR